VCAWRRLFALRDEEEELQLERVREALEEEIDDRDDCPIRSRDVVEERTRFGRDYYRRAIADGDSSQRQRSQNVGPLNRPGADYDGQVFLQRIVLDRARQSEQDDRLLRRQPDLAVAVVPATAAATLAAAAHPSAAMEVESIYLAQ